MWLKLLADLATPALGQYFFYNIDIHPDQQRLVLTGIYATVAESYIVL